MKAVELELLAPAKNLEVGKVAIDCGADAVYIGAADFGARASAGNTTEDIAALVEYAHRFGARVYVTMNTILYEDELPKARALAMDLYNIGVDALIVQDMAYVAMGLPIALHASTQCDIRTPAKAAWLAAAGFKRLVLPREFTPERIAESAAAAGVPMEVFIHGARCVSYSGDCQIGYAATGRSANRGACPQMCRLPYDLVDKEGRAVGPRRHYLSLSDLRTPDLQTLVDAGATSFKIEGRLKDRRYVANAVAWYSRELDGIVSRSEGKYVRASYGRSECGFEPDISKGFFRRPNGSQGEACLASPNDTGVPVATVSRPFNPRTRSFRIKGNKALANGDGLGYFGADGEFHGFRLNRVAADECFPATALPDLKGGLTLYRNADKAFNDSVDAAVPLRRLRVDFTLEYADGRLVLRAHDEMGRQTEYSEECEYSASRNPQQEQRRKLLGRLGDTVYVAGEVVDRIGDMFVPASLLTAMRRAVVSLLESQHPHRPEEPGVCRLAPDAFAGMHLDYHDNVANSMARKFYESRGAVVEEQALECESPAKGKGRRVMATRYCIRRELGACIKEGKGGALPSPLFLRNESGLYRLHFDCARCGMDIYKEN